MQIPHTHKFHMAFDKPIVHQPKFAQNWKVPIFESVGQISYLYGNPIPGSLSEVFIVNQLHSPGILSEEQLYYIKSFDTQIENSLLFLFTISCCTSKRECFVLAEGTVLCTPHRNQRGMMSP